MSAVLVLIPPGLDAGALPPGASPLRLTAVSAALDALHSSPAPAVICTDTLAAEDLPRLAHAIRERAAPCIEVRSGPWDGESTSPVAAACRGVISGFGTGGLQRAAALLAAGD